MVHFYNPLRYSVPDNSLLLKNYQFSVNNNKRRGNKGFIFIAIQILLLQKSYNLDISIINTKFAHVHNSLALYYYSEACKTTSKNSLNLIDIHVCNDSLNSADSTFLPLFHPFMDVVFSDTAMEQQMADKSHLL